MKYKLPKEFIEKWTSALRSGVYEQGREMLMDGESHCCLGVACAIAGDDLEIHGGNAYVGEWSNSPLANLHRDDDLQDVLAGLNDNEGKSFSEIADWIDKNIELV